MAMTLFTTTGVLMLAGAFALQILYVMAAQAQESTERIEEFQIPAGIVNGAVVMYILYSLVYYRPYAKTWVMALVLFLLIGGMIGEIYLSIYEKDMPDVISTYFILGFNALTRLYILIDIHCESPLTSVPGLLKEITKPIVQAIPSAPPPPVDMMPVYDKILQSISGLRRPRTEDLSDEQWRAIKDNIRSALGMAPKVGGRRR